MKRFTITFVMLLLIFSASAQKKGEKSFYDKALMKIEFENYEGALSDLDKAIESDSLNSNAFFKRGFVKAMLLDHKGALADFDRAILLNPNEAQIYSERGVARLNLDDRDGACSDWKKAASMGFDAAKDLAYEYCP